MIDPSLAAVIDAVVKEYVRRTLETDETIRAYSRIEPNDVPSYQTAIDSLIKDAQEALARNDVSGMSEEIRALVPEWDRLQKVAQLTPGSEDFRVLCRECLKAKIVALNVIKARSAGDYDNPYDRSGELVLSAARQAEQAEPDNPVAAGTSSQPAPEVPPVVVNLPKTVFMADNGATRPLSLNSRTPCLETMSATGGKQKTVKVTLIQLLRFLSLWRASRNPYVGMVHSGPGADEKRILPVMNGSISRASPLCLFLRDTFENPTHILSSAVKAVLEEPAQTFRDESVSDYRRAQGKYTRFRLRDGVEVNADWDVLNTALCDSCTQKPADWQSVTPDAIRKFVAELRRGS